MRLKILHLHHLLYLHHLLNPHHLLNLQPIRILI